jgi:uncharacterized protein YidB (DUF937 family)
MTDVQKIIQEQGPALVQQLTTRLGFSQQQAQGFTNKLAPKVVEVFKSGFDVKSVLGGADFNAIIGRLGLGEIASQVGIDLTKATEGAKTVLPGLVQAYQKQGGLSGIVQSAKGATGDIVKKAGEAFGKS